MDILSRIDEAIHDKEQELIKSKSNGSSPSIIVELESRLKTNKYIRGVYTKYPDTMEKLS